jgi:endonuclease-8
VPEGPEVRREADRVQRALKDRVLEEVRFGLERLEPHGPELVGRRFLACESRGKALLCHLEGQRTIYSHNQLYGKWIVGARGARPRGGRQVRLALAAGDKQAVLYSASEIEVWDTPRLGEQRYLAKLGPDALDKRTHPEAVVERLQSPCFRRRSLGALLLDQGFVAGLGNYLRSEILFFSGLHPAWRGADLGDEEAHELATQVLARTRQAYTTRGVTNDLDLVAELEREGWRRVEFRHAVFSRAGQACHWCGTPIERVEHGGRRLYLCTTCQPGPV